MKVVGEKLSLRGVVYDNVVFYISQFYYHKLTYTINFITIRLKILPQNYIKSIINKQKLRKEDAHGDHLNEKSASPSNYNALIFAIHNITIHKPRYPIA